MYPNRVRIPPLNSPMAAPTSTSNTTMRRTPAAAGGGSEELLWTRTKKTSTSNSTLRTRRKSYSSHHLCVSSQGPEKRPFSFGPVPTKAEAEEALSALQRLFLGDATKSTDHSTELVDRVSSSEMGSNMIVSARQQDLQPKPVQSQGVARAFEAFRMLVFNPVVQRMVVSLSTDKAIWDAVMKNELVQEIQQSFSSESIKPQNSEGEPPDIATIILKWILENTKAKLIEFIDKITNLLNELFHSKESKKKSTPSNFDQVVRSAFTISVIVFMIIIVKRME